MKQLFVLILLACWITSFGQTIKGVSIAAMNEEISFPFTRFTPIHPGVEVGITFREVEKEKSIRNLNLNVGFYHHEKIENGIYLRGEYQFRPKLGSLLTFDLSGSLGYLHTFFPGEIYEMNESSYEFEKVNQSGRSHLTGALGMGFTLVKTEKIQPFIRQELMVETPFASGVPVIIHSFLKLGVNIKF